MRMEFHGSEELVRDFQKATESYYNLAEESLTRVGRKYKTTLRKRVRGEVKTDKKLTKGFYTSKPIGNGGDLRVNFSGEGKVNPHWHLIERGHELVRPNVNRFKKPYKDAGAHIGHVGGIEQIDALADSGEVDDVMEKEMLTALDKALEAGDLR